MYGRISKQLFLADLNQQKKIPEKILRMYPKEQNSDLYLKTEKYNLCTFKCKINVPPSPNLIFEFVLTPQ